MEFVGGVKKHMQFSIDGLEECLDLKTIQVGSGGVKYSAIFLKVILEFWNFSNPLNWS